MNLHTARKSTALSFLLLLLPPLAFAAGTEMPPFGWTRFCVQNPSSGCSASGSPDWKEPEEVISQLNAVNDKVNHSIKPDPDKVTKGFTKEGDWQVNPEKGNCNDYAVSKRDALLKMGYPTRVLRLAEVITGSGEHHLIMVVTTKKGDYALDNLAQSVTPVRALGAYKWVRIQAQEDPSGLWQKVDRLPKQ